MYEMKDANQNYEINSEALKLLAECIVGDNEFCVHGGSSASLAIMLKSTYHQLMAAGVQRKRYQLPLFCGEQGPGLIEPFTGRRRNGVSHKNISVMYLNRYYLDGLTTAAHYAANTKKYCIDEIKQATMQLLENFRSIILCKENRQINDTLLLLRLWAKRLENNLRAVAVWEKPPSNYITTIRQTIDELKILLKSSPLQFSSEPEVQRIIDKYLEKYLQILDSPCSHLTADDEFQELITNQFGIIYVIDCKQVKISPFSEGVHNEHIIKEEVPLAAVSYIFTAAENHPALTSLLKKLQAEHIKILPLPYSKKPVSTDSYSSLSQFYPKKKTKEKNIMIYQDEIACNDLKTNPVLDYFP